MYSFMKIIFLGKSTIANAICLCLGAQARTTGRTSNVQSFIRKGET
jgi:chromosome segregation ATPase